MNRGRPLYSSSATTTLFLDEDWVEVEIDFTFSPGDPGRLTGPPENCYPPEGPDIEIVKAVRTDTDEAVAVDIEDVYDHLADIANEESASY